MKHTLYILTGLMLTSSCATIINEPYRNVTVYTTKPSKIIHLQDTVVTSKNKINLRVERKKAPLEITLATDSLTKTIHVKSKNSPAYWLNLLYTYGIGMLIEKNNPKRYSYPRRIYVNSSDTLNKYATYRRRNEGELDLHLSLPHINIFNFKPKNEERKINAGFLGLTLGLDYYHTKNQFLNFGISGVIDFPVPVPDPLAIVDGEYEFMRSTYISLSNNHRFGRFSTGYGISYSINNWNLINIMSDDSPQYQLNSPPPIRRHVSVSHKTLGLIFQNYFQVGKNFHIGLIYRPDIVQPFPVNKFVYEHLISIDFAWKIRIAKIKVK